MDGITIEAALLLRALSSFFGSDRILYSMSLYAVCSGVVNATNDEEVFFSKDRKCLFTIVDASDNPKLVIDLLPDQNSSIDMNYYEHQLFVEQSLKNSGVHYVTFSSLEIENLKKSSSSDDEFVSMLLLKVVDTE